MQHDPKSPTGPSSPRTRTAGGEKRATTAPASPSPAPTTPEAVPSPPQSGATPAQPGVVDQAKETISNVATQAGEQVTSRLDRQKDRAADGLRSFAEALRQTGQQLRERDQGAVQQYVDTVADQVERFSGYLQSKNVSQFVDQLEDVARRQPALFLGSAFALGFLGTRFLKSSRPRSPAHSGSSLPGPRPGTRLDSSRGSAYGRGDLATPGPESIGYGALPGTRPVAGREEV